MQCFLNQWNLTHYVAFKCGDLVNFPQYQQNFLDFLVLHTSNHFFLAISNVLLNRTQESSGIFVTITIFFCSSFFGVFFWAPMHLHVIISSMNTTLVLWERAGIFFSNKLKIVYVFIFGNFSEKDKYFLVRKT